MRADKLIPVVIVGLVTVVSPILFVAPLQAQTQAQLNAVARKDFAKADADLNKTYQTVLAKLPNAERQKLKESQRAWIKSRDAEGASAAEETDGASIGPTVRYGRMTELTRKRIDELKAMIDSATAPGPQASASPSESPQPSAVAEAEPKARPTPAQLSPDKKWEYIGGENPKLVNAGTKEVALEFPCRIGGATLLWAPDLKRFALTCEGGKGNGTSVYLQRDSHWEAPEEELGNGDEIMDRAGNTIEAQAKKKGLPKKTFLHMNRWTVEPVRWQDSHTLVVYAAMIESVHTREGEHVGPSYGTDLLLTLRFDDAGKWKIVKTHHMSLKEAEKREKEQREVP